jgi:hypothetical protein
MLRLTLAAALFAVASAAPAADLVGTIPGFDKAPFDTYSGYLTVPGPFKLNSYSSLKIAYILNTAQVRRCPQWSLNAMRCAGDARRRLRVTFATRY